MDDYYSWMSLPVGGADVLVDLLQFEYTCCVFLLIDFGLKILFYSIIGNTYLATLFMFCSFSAHIILYNGNKAMQHVQQQVQDWYLPSVAEASTVIWTL